MSGFNHWRECRHGTMLFNVNDSYIGRALDLYGEWSPGEIELFEKIVSPGDIVVEVGANIGSHTLRLAQLAGPEGAVLAFEPQRIVFQTLCANMALNSVTNVHCYHNAVGRERGVILVPRLDYHRRRNYGALALGTFERGERVQVVRLDDFPLPRCRLLKADVEGMEIDVIQGAVGLIRRLKPILYVENGRRDRSKMLIRLIDELGYDLYSHRPPYFSPDNYRNNAENVFGAMVSLNMLGMPRGQVPPLSGLSRIGVPGPRPGGEAASAQASPVLEQAAVSGQEEHPASSVVDVEQ